MQQLGSEATLRAAAAARPRSIATTLANTASDCLALTKPRVTLLVVLTAIAAEYVGAQAPLPMAAVAWLALGTALLAGGSAASNQVWERRTDGLMARTRARPLPAHRLQPPPAALLAGLLIASGAATLWMEVNRLSALCGLATAGVYLLVYTPMKFRTPHSTTVGALPGAGPVLMGWAASRGRLDAGAWALFAIQFLWQFPHFLAIAWIYREQYQRAGIRMLPVLDPSGTQTGRQVLLYSMALLPVSLLPTFLGLTGITYLIGACLLSTALLAVGWRAARAATSAGYRELLHASIIYLPLLFGLMAWNRR